MKLHKTFCIRHLQGGPKKSWHLCATNFNITQIPLLPNIWWQNIHKWKGYTREGLFFSVSALSCQDYFRMTSDNVTGLREIVFCHFGPISSNRLLYGQNQYVGPLTGIILYSCPYNAILRIKIGALWSPHIPWPEWLLVLHPAILGFSWRFGQEYQPVGIHRVSSDPWLDLRLHNFQIMSCVNLHAWCKHFLAIRRY